MDKVMCVDCAGDGEWSLGSHSTRCQTCKGSGKITEQERHEWRVKNNKHNYLTSIPYEPKKRYNKNTFFDFE